MLTLQFGAWSRDCAGLTRRSFLRAGALGLGGLSDVEGDREAFHRLGWCIRAHQHHAIADQAGMDDLLAPLERHASFRGRAFMRDHRHDLAVPRQRSRSRES